MTLPGGMDVSLKEDQWQPAASALISPDTSLTSY